MRMTLKLVCLLLAPLIVACGGARDRDESILRINIRSNPPDLDPALSQDTSSSKVLHGLMEALTRLDKDAQPQPAAATAWRALDGYTTWEFDLRPGMRWHNGDPVTAQDWVYALRRILTPETASPRAEILFRILRGSREYFAAGGLDSTADWDGVEILDDGAGLRFNLVAPDPLFAVHAGSAPFVPIHRPTVEAHGPAWVERPATFNGNGPFRMSEWRSGQVLRIVKNPDYWDAANVHWQTVEFLMIDSDATAEAAFRTGDVDVVNLIPTSVDEWRGRPETQIAPGLAIYYVIFNRRTPPFDNREIRLALSRAINRTLITRDITRAGEIPATGIVPSTVPGARPGRTYRDTAGDMIGAFNLDEARAILSSAGYTDSNPVPMFTFSYNTAENNKLIAEQLQRMWTRLPIRDVRINNMEWGVYLQEARAGRLQTFRMGWVVPPDPILFLEIFTTGHPNNYSGYSNPRFDELLESALHERDLERREDLLAAAERILLVEDAAVAPLFVYTLPYLVNADIEGLHVNPLDELTYIRARRRE